MELELAIKLKVTLYITQQHLPTKFTQVGQVGNEFSQSGCFRQVKTVYIPLAIHRHHLSSNQLNKVPEENVAHLRKYCSTGVENPVLSLLFLNGEGSGK